MKSGYFAILSVFVLSRAQEENHTEACKNALTACENDLECSNRLAPLMAACTTGTCQPQCRNAVLNVYQNKIGRTLLRSDASCIPGREELKTCRFLPTGEQVHCSLAKLACEADLQCNAKWGTYVAECEGETSRAECSGKCRQLYDEAVSTQFGAAFKNCSCTEREDHLCHSLRDNLLGACTKPTPAPPVDGDNSVTDIPMDAVAAAAEVVPFLLLGTLLLVRAVYEL